MPQRPVFCPNLAEEITGELRVEIQVFTSDMEVITFLKMISLGVLGGLKFSGRSWQGVFTFDKSVGVQLFSDMTF